MIPVLLLYKKIIYDAENVHYWHKKVSHLLYITFSFKTTATFTLEKQAPSKEN